MSDILRVQPFDLLLRRMLAEYEHSRSIFGIHESLWHKPRKDAPYVTQNMFGKHLSTPIGPSAGPHTQLSQNIISAWLCGGRFIELKTVQIMDELVIPRPCIDMEDEGYNVEWSQELKLEESAQEYVNAWARDPPAAPPAGLGGRRPSRHDLRHERRLQPGRHQDPAHDALHGPDGRCVRRSSPRSRPSCSREFPQFADIQIPSRLTNSVTLSTMHGCPPDEIERIARYLLEERGLHTVVKMNPTLLGKDARAEHPARRSRLHRSRYPGLGLRERPEVRARRSG